MESCLQKWLVQVCRQAVHFKMQPAFKIQDLHHLCTEREAGGSVKACFWSFSGCSNLMGEVSVSHDRTVFMKPAVSNPQASSKSAGPHRAVSVPVWMAAVLLPSVLWVLIYFHPLPYFMVAVDKIN